MEFPVDLTAGTIRLEDIKARLMHLADNRDWDAAERREWAELQDIVSGTRGYSGHVEIDGYWHPAELMRDDLFRANARDRAEEACAGRPDLLEDFIREIVGYYSCTSIRGVTYWY